MDIASRCRLLVAIPLFHQFLCQHDTDLHYRDGIFNTFLSERISTIVNHGFNNRLVFCYSINFSVNKIQICITVMEFSALLWFPQCSPRFIIMVSITSCVMVINQRNCKRTVTVKDKPWVPTLTSKQ